MSRHKNNNSINSGSPPRTFFTPSMLNAVRTPASSTGHHHHPQQRRHSNASGSSPGASTTGYPWTTPQRRGERETERASHHHDYYETPSPSAAKVGALGAGVRSLSPRPMRGSRGLATPPSPSRWSDGGVTAGGRDGGRGRGGDDDGEDSRLTSPEEQRRWQRRREQSEREARPVREPVHTRRILTSFRST